MRFPILISPLWRPFLLPLGGTPQRSFAELEDGHLRIRFGWLFDQRFRISDVEGASPSHWPVWAGVGWRTDFRRTAGLIGTYVNIVEVRFKKPQRVRMVLPVPCERLYLSLEEPREFIAALQAASAKQDRREPAAASADGATAARPRRRKKAG